MVAKNKVIVFVLPRSPWPPFAGQSRLTFYRAIELKKLGYRVILITISNFRNLSSNDLQHFKEIFHEVHFIKLKKLDFLYIFLNALFFRSFRNIPLQNSWLNSPRILNLFEEKLKILIKKNKKIIFHFYSIRTFYLWSLAEKYKKPFFIDLIDSMSLNIKSKFFNKIEFHKKIFWNLEYKSISYFEKNLPFYQNCKGFLVVSEIDKKFLSLKNYNYNNLIFVNNIGCEIPNKLNQEAVNDNNIIFFGSLNYEPNITAIKWLVEKVMPNVWKKDSSIILNIAGSSPSGGLLKKFKNNPKINLIPNPKSMSNIIKKSLIAVAPLISGSGQQFKIIEAMANGLPVVASSKVAIPFKFINKKDLLIEDDYLKFADAILELKNSYKMREELRTNSFLKIKNKYSWESSVKNLEIIYKN